MRWLEHKYYTVQAEHAALQMQAWREALRKLGYVEIAPGMWKLNDNLTVWEG